MKSRVLIPMLMLMLANCIVLQPDTGMADPIGRLPELVVKDTNGTLLGPRSQASGSTSVTVLRKDPVNGDIYDLLVAANSLRGADSNDVWYTNADCTGTAYVVEPAGVFSPAAAMRGSVYAVGRSAGATNEDCLILRGAGSGSDQDAAINSRYRTLAPGTPSCTNNGQFDPGVNVVQATQIDDLCSLVRPFVAE